jgi:glycyl-tRNA synthetase
MSDTAPTTKTMDDIVALCRRRGFIWQSSEIYGGINGFWDYGPLGAELKRNLKDAWWQDIVKCPPAGPDGSIIDMVGVDCTIIMNPKVWVASGHVAGFNDPMVDDKETKQRFRADHLFGLFVEFDNGTGAPDAMRRIHASLASHDMGQICVPLLTVIASNRDEALDQLEPVARKNGFTIEGNALVKVGDDALSAMQVADRRKSRLGFAFVDAVSMRALREIPQDVPSPYTQKSGALTEPRQFNLMFPTYIGAVFDEESKTYLRPETAQGIFANFRNVVDTSRVKVPFGIAQVGKAFRNEVTPRNFTFRSREFEQMEIEFFIRPDSAKEWYAYWRDSRYAWWQSIGLSSSNLQLREHDRDELAHYAKDGAGTSDIEYRFPFTAPGFGELEGVAHRTDFDLRQHAEHSGLKDKLKYFDQEKNERYFPHVIEPSAGADRGTLALLCEAYTPDESRPSKVYMAFHPRMAPIKAGIFPLVNKDGMPEIGDKLYLDLRKRYNIEFDVKQSIGKRYARMDEAGTPYCFTIDGDTLKDQTVTVRHRDTQQQERIALDQVGAFLAEKLG